MDNIYSTFINILFHNLLYFIFKLFVIFFSFQWFAFINGDQQRFPENAVKIFEKGGSAQIFPITTAKEVQNLVAEIFEQD